MRVGYLRVSSTDQKRILGSLTGPVCSMLNVARTCDTHDSTWDFQAALFHSSVWWGAGEYTGLLCHPRRFGVPYGHGFHVLPPGA